jgi:arylsulfatase A-like enzyme
VQHRRGALAGLCAVVAMFAAACAAAASAEPTAEPTAQSTAAVATGVAALAAGAPVPSEQGADKGAPGPPPAGDDAGTDWEVGPAWAQHPEVLPGSRRFRELVRVPATSTQRPNVVVITTDDMTATDLRWMPKTRGLLGRAGVSFADSLSLHPLCCPARAQLLTGQFAHNNGVWSNKSPYGGYYRLDSERTLPVWLQQAGYYTAFMGKYLNEYGHEDRYEVPPGWDFWRAPVTFTYDYYDYTVNADGQLRRLDDYYQTEYYTELTEELVPRLAREDRPFFLWQSHLAPHSTCSAVKLIEGDRCWSPPTPSREHYGTLDDVRPPQRRDPSYDEADVSDKPAKIRNRPAFDARRHAYERENFQRRVESLASVDDAVARTVDMLERAGELDETLLIFTSDNGYLLGEHRYTGKTVPYEPSLRVPLLMRGPGVPRGVTSTATTGTLDLAVTIAAAAGAEPNVVVDGRNLLPVASGDRPGWDTVLILGGPKGKKDGPEWYYKGVRTQRYTYVEYRQTGEVELYDRERDPYQMRNVAGSPAYADVQVELRSRLLALENCSGEACRRDFGPVAEPAAAAFTR